MSIFSKFFIPAAVKVTKDPRAKLIFHDSDIVFACDLNRGFSKSCFPYYLGATGQEFNIATVAEYVQRYAAPRGYSEMDVANAYADYAQRVAIERSEFYGDRNLYVNAWMNPSERGLAKGWEKDENHSLFLDFAAFFLLDVLRLEIR